MLLEDIETQIALKFLGKDKQKVPTDYSSVSVMKKYYRGMVQRVKSGSYKKKGIKVEISLNDFSEFWFSRIEQMKKIQDAGFVVSVDRIDSSGNYSLENIRLLPLHLNRALGKLEMCLGEMKRLYSTLSDLEKWV